MFKRLLAPPYPPTAGKRSITHDSTRLTLHTPSEERRTSVRHRLWAHFDRDAARVYLIQGDDGSGRC